MKTHLAAAALLLLGVGSLAAQAPAAPTPSAAEAKAAFEIWQVDLVPTGSGFAVTKPVLEGDNWVFQVWPERDTVRIPKAKIKKVTPRTKQLQSETAYRLDLAPSGEIFSRDQPVRKGTTYTFHRWRNGTLMSLRQTDVKKVTKLTPVEIFQTHLQYFGPRQIGNLAMEGGTATIIPAPGASTTSAPSGGSEPVYNWIYEGTPGIDDAWAPPSAVVAYPGDVPKAPE